MNNEIGLYVEFDGKKNVVMCDGVVKEFPVGGMICEYARLHPTDLKPIILGLSSFNATNVMKKCGEATFEYYKILKDKYGVLVATVIATDFANIIADYLQADKNGLMRLLRRCNKDRNKDEVKKFILENSGYSDFGIRTIGQLFLTAYSTYALSYVNFRYIFDIVVSQKDVDQKIVNAIFSMYDENFGFQDIGFKIMFYDHNFHSVYTIKSSLSLILFELAHAINNDTNFVKCKNCGKYFVPVGRADTLYCGYASPQDKNKTCRDLGAKVSRAQKVKNDIVVQEYRRLYMRLQMAIKRHPTNMVLKEQLKKLTIEMKQLRKKKDSGIVSSDDILEWLQSIDDKCGKKQ